MLTNTASSDVALNVGNRNMEAGTCSQKYVFSREMNLCYPFYNYGNTFHEGLPGFVYSIALYSSEDKTGFATLHHCFCSCCAGIAE
jgi:hypothetical protein